MHNTDDLRFDSFDLSKKVIRFLNHFNLVTVSEVKEFILRNGSNWIWDVHGLNLGTHRDIVYILTYCYPGVKFDYKDDEDYEKLFTDEEISIIEEALFESLKDKDLKNVSPKVANLIYLSNTFKNRILTIQGDL